MSSLLNLLPSKYLTAVLAVKRHAEGLLNTTPRFKFFTLHGTSHINNLFRISDILIAGGLKLSEEEALLYSLALCVHDLGMVVGLSDKDLTYIFSGKEVSTDPAIVETQIRDLHHEMVDLYMQKNLGFLIDIGLTPAQLSYVIDISRCHRKVILVEKSGFVQYLGALLRVVDELDIGPSRAPAAALANMLPELDASSCWHWYKHNIVLDWSQGLNVSFSNSNGRHNIDFNLAVCPTKERSIPYWLTQIKRPILRALDDDGCRRIIQDQFGIVIDLRAKQSASKAVNLGPMWEEVEDKALSGGRRVIMLIDDEVRKMDDLMLPLSFDYHVVYASNAKDAISKAEAGRVDLAIVDMQIGALGMWTKEQTSDFKMTGLNLIHEFKTRFPAVKLGVLTGTKYDISTLSTEPLAFVLKKPMDPDAFVKSIKHALRN